MRGLLHEFALHMQVERTPLEVIEYHQLVKFVDWVKETSPEYYAAPEMYATLKMVEWIHPKYAGACPWCLEQPKDGHADDCQRQAALANAKED